LGALHSVFENCGQSGLCNMIQLSKRLRAVADFVPPDGVLADIGTDHALLPTFLVQLGKVPRAIAGDIHVGPAQAAERQVAATGLGAFVSVRIGDGLAVLSPGEADTISIAGMGGGTMVDILDSGRAALQGVQRLVLQPNIGERLVREWLVEQGWKLMTEVLLEEDGLLYEVLAADAADREEAKRWNDALYSKELPGYGPLSRTVQLLMGPHLLENPSPLFIRKWRAYVEKLNLLIEQISRSEQPEAKRKREALVSERQEVSEVLSCLSK
jgi:tRNA (adenine22-N1)-methyltransferase